MPSKSDKELMLLSLSKLKNNKTSINKNKMSPERKRKVEFLLEVTEKLKQNFKQTLNFVIVLTKQNRFVLDKNI